MEGSEFVMVDYDEPIDITEYLYRKPVYFTNPHSTYQTNLIVKLVLTEDNFNFNLANEDGSDFRLMEYKTGIGVLKTYVAYWNNVLKRAILFFKVPDIGGSASVTFTAYWGNPNATAISDPANLGFLFYEEFSSSTLDSSKWTDTISSTLTDYGFLFPADKYFTSITDPLINESNWVIECGVYPNFDELGVYSTAYRTFGIGLIGTENDFIVNVMHLNKVSTNAVVVDAASYTDSTALYGGLEGYTYQEAIISYYEYKDLLSVILQTRANYEDYTHEFVRKVEGDTRPVNIRCYGRGSGGYNSGGYPCYISWLIVRSYDGGAAAELDGSDLFVEYGIVDHQNQDFREYGPDLTSSVHMHESSFGGNPYLLSEGGYDADTNVWQSDVLATSEDYIYATIHTAWQSDVTSTTYTHYDSGHVYYYNAAKLSDEDSDRMSRSYWKSTTTSGWAAIKFSSSREIGAFRIKNTTVSGAMPKNYTFYGTNYNPTLFFDRAIAIKSGTFYQTEEWQAVVLTNVSLYRYYVLYIYDTYGDENIEIQEWQMMDYIGQGERRYVSQLRLHPALYGTYEANFPKEVSLQGSVDGLNWTTLMPWTYTYTPQVSHIAEYGYWQRYSFDNINGYWSFRLLCRDNWYASDGKIIIGEWSLHELASEANTYRILTGTSNNISQIWALDNYTLDSIHSVLFIANDRLNRISSNKIVDSEDLPEGYVDFNVV